MKVVERIFECRIWQQINIYDMQFGFVKDKGITDAIFLVRQTQEKFRAKGKKLYFGFVDLEKTFDRVPREAMRWAMHRKGVEDKHSHAGSTASFCNLVALAFHLLNVNACQATVVHCMSNKFCVDSSSCFPFRICRQSQTDTHICTPKVTDGVGRCSLECIRM